MSRVTVAIGRRSPTNITEGTITCPCGYRGQPLEVERWEMLPSGWLGLCPCGSSRQVEPKERGR